ncbi:uncharacterized protein LOC129618514 [Condylostylus longicornis]|uniref:uncharacterized protein LOC129618514 n=1 Tax=Condylostylus longicornis TaxID=2530218 RepID=UPI00244DF4B3|nr:uncharacterized protein LOC129618514 [Condylostylus longicornis]
MKNANTEYNQYSYKTSINSLKDKKITSTTSGGNINNKKIRKKFKKKNKKTSFKPYVIPIFGKRKKRDTDIPSYDKYDLIDINYHRTSRQELYEKLEKFLDQLGQNGTECILKSLCEIGQREDDTEPVDIFREILRAIFTLPQPVFKVKQEKHKIYDEAHSYEGDCNEKYPLCPTSVWAE